MSAPSLYRAPSHLNAASGLVAGFTMRQGGVSEPPFDALNLGLSTADAAEAVQKNRRRMAAAAGFSVEALAIAGQVHSADVETVTAPGLYPGIDGLVTRQRGLLLCISAADCAAVLLADVEAGVIGACHAGWRGTVAGIVPNTITSMQRIGAVPARLYAYISPCISVRHFEVGPEVAARFEPAFVRKKPDWPRPHVDLKAAIAAQLVAAGVPEPAIEIDPACTYAGTDRFFSYRAEQGQTGRMMGFIGLRSGAL